MSTYSNRLQPSSPKHIIACTCLVLPPEIVMHDAYIGGLSENNIKCVVHDNLGRKNRTTRYKLQVFCRVTGFIFQFHSCGIYLVLSHFTEPFNYFRVIWTDIQVSWRHRWRLRQIKINELTYTCNLRNFYILIQFQFILSRSLTLSFNFLLHVFIVV